MADTNIQLPPNSTGQQIRVETGDSANQMPTGVGTEVVIVSDSQGLMTGDARQQPIKVEVDLDIFNEILLTLGRIEQSIKLGLDVDLNNDDYEMD